MNAYEERNRILKRLGYETYADYLASDLWAKIRRKVLRKFKNRCVMCPNTATQVHHRQYSEDALIGTDRRFLVALCNACHEAIEFEGLLKRPFAAVDAELDSTLREQLKEGFARHLKRL